MKKPKVLIIIICTFTNLLPARSFAEEYYFECRKGYYTSVLTINTRTNVVVDERRYGTNGSSSYNNNLISYSPYTFTWEKEGQIKYPSYLKISEVLDRNIKTTNTLNRETFQMLETIKMQDNIENKTTIVREYYQCIEGK